MGIGIRRTEKRDEEPWEALAPFRQKVLVATKFGFKIVDGKQSGLDSRPQHVKEVAQALLKRLKYGPACAPKQEVGVILSRSWLLKAGS